MFFPWQWVSRDLALAWVLGASQAQRRDVAADPKSMLRIKPAEMEEWEGPAQNGWSNKTATKGLQREHGQAHWEGGDGREQESL